MPKIEHIADSSISSILDNSIKTPSIFNSTEDYERYFTWKNRKYSVEAVYLGNVWTPTHKTYQTLDLVPRLPQDDFFIRYGNESRVQQFLSKYPERITTWTEDINGSNNITNNISSTLSPLSDSSANSKTAKTYSSTSSSRILLWTFWISSCYNPYFISHTVTFITRTQHGYRTPCSGEKKCNKIRNTYKEAEDEPTHG